MALARAIRWAIPSLIGIAAACIHRKLPTGTRPAPDGTFHFIGLPLEPRTSHPVQKDPSPFLGVSPAPESTTQGELPYWSRAASVSKILDLVVAGRTAEIPSPSGFGEMKARWTDHRYPHPIDFNGDGKKEEVLLLRTLEVPRVDDRTPSGGAPMMAWLLAIPTTGGTITPETEKRAVPVASYFGPVVENPIRRIEVGNWDPFPGADVRYEQWNPTTKGYLGWDSSSRPGEHVLVNPPAVRDLIEGVAYYLDSIYEAKMGAYALSLIDTRYEPFAQQVDAAYTQLMSRNLRPFYGEFRRMAENPSQVLPQILDPHSAVYSSIARVIYTQLASIHLFTEEENTDELSTFGRLEAEFGAHARGFEFEGKKIASRRELQEALKKEPQEERRRRLWRAYGEHFDSFHARPGNLYDVISRMNRYARAHGFATMVDKVYPFRFGMTGEEFDRRLQQIFDETQAEAEAYLAELRQVKKRLAPESDGTIWVWDLDYLSEVWLQELTGGEEPRLTQGQLWEVVHRVYRDLGIDLSQPPYNRIVRDVFKRETKASLSGMALPAQLGRSYFTSDLVPGAEVSMRQLDTILHEVAHTVNFQLAGDFSAGFYLLSGEYAPSYWSEGIAMTIAKIVKDPRLARRYLPYPQFPERYFRALEKMTPLKSTFDLRGLLLVAWMEANLYRETDTAGSPRTLAERRQAWAKRLLAVQGVRDSEDGVSAWAALPHLTYKEYHLYYPSYSFGQAATDRIFNAHIQRGSADELRRFGEATIWLMRLGAGVTAQDLERAVPPSPGGGGRQR